MTDIAKVARLRNELQAEFKGNVPQAVLFSAALFEEMGDVIKAAAMRAVWYDEPDLACEFLKLAHRVQENGRQITDEMKVEWEALSNRLLAISLEWRPEEGR